MEVQIGRVCFKNGHGSILERGAYYDRERHGFYDFVNDPRGVVPRVVGFSDDDLIVIENVDAPPQVEAARRLVRPGAALGCMLSALNFDPPQDHPQEPEFENLDAVVYDFRQINDELDTVEGVRGNHFTTLLEWQPRIDTSRTTLFALIEVGTIFEVRPPERGAASRLAATLDANGYDAAILVGHELHGSADMEILTAFAAEMDAAVELPLIIATPERLESVPAPFVMNFTVGQLY